MYVNSLKCPVMRVVWTFSNLMRRKIKHAKVGDKRSLGTLRYF